MRDELLWQRLSAVSVNMFGVSEKCNEDGEGLSRSGDTRLYDISIVWGCVLV